MTKNGRLHIAIISLVFPPETGSARRVGELAGYLARRGHRVTVVTGFPSYPKGAVFPGYEKSLIFKERWDKGVEVIRTYLYTSTNRKRTLPRLLHYGTFTASSILGGIFGGRADVVYVVSPPYFLGLSGLVVARLHGAKLVFDVQDFWPEAPISLGYVKNPTLIKLLIGLERHIYDRSDVIFALSPKMKDFIVDRGVHPEKVKVIYNWVDIGAYGERLDVSLRRRLGLDGKFVVLFAGNLGRAQGLDTVIEAASLLCNDGEPAFVFLGDGIEKDRLQAMSRELNLSNTLFLEGVPEGEVPPYLRMADALLVSLKRARHRQAAIPSKLQVYMAAGKPVLAALEGAAAEVVKEAGCGEVVEPDDPEDLARAVKKLKDQAASKRIAQGKAGRAFAKSFFDKERQCSRIHTELTSLFTTI